MFTEREKVPRKRVPKQPKIVKKTTADLKRDVQMKLAEILKGEDLIYNTQNKLHSNIHAVAAAWDRIAVKMDKSGM